MNVSNHAKNHHFILFSSSNHLKAEDFTNTKRNELHNAMNCTSHFIKSAYNATHTRTHKITMHYRFVPIRFGHN
jgi:hypothetical protein